MTAVDWATIDRDLRMYGHDPQLQLDRWTWWEAIDANEGVPLGTNAARNGEPRPGEAYAQTAERPNNVATPVPGPDPTVTAQEAADNKASFNQLAVMLKDAGLDGLFTTDTNGNPSGWLWDRILDGTIDNRDSLQLAIEQTDQFKQRYWVIQEARNRGQSYIPTMADVRNYERESGRILRAAGLPPDFYDNFMDFQQLMIKGLSVDELERRLGHSWEMVQNSDPLVRQKFNEFFGTAGDSMLAAMFLDPGYTEANLDKFARTAYTAGMGARMGINVDKTMAERLADLPKTEAGFLQDFGQVNAISNVFDEGVTEVADLTAEGTGLGAIALGGADEQAAINKRIGERQANNRSTSGGAAVTQTGVVGLGSGGR